MSTLKNKKSKKTNTKKVTRKFLLNLANTIYDVKTRRFLRLCKGTLQNGPDPKDATRPMHCGLGELYFAMTGVQPHERNVDEDDVVSLAVELSSIREHAKKLRTHAVAKITKCKLSSYVKDNLIDCLNRFHNDDLTDVAEFRDLLKEIPTINDDVCEDCQNGSCSFDSFRKRACHVARQLRKAAMLLPA